MASPVPGGIEEIPNAGKRLEIQVLARWGVYEENKKENTVLNYVKVLKASQQLVEGIMFYIELETKNALDGHTKLYEAKIWAKDWENFIELVEFKQLIGDATHSTTGAN